VRQCFSPACRVVLLVIPKKVAVVDEQPLQAVLTKGYRTLEPKQGLATVVGLRMN
jgi:hypothetical protein